MILARLQRLLMVGMVLGAGAAGAWAGAPSAAVPAAPAADLLPAPGAPAAETSPEMTEWRSRMRTAQHALRRRDFPTAEAEFTAAIKVAETLSEPEQYLSASLALLMECYSVQGKHTQAIGPGERLLQIRTKVDGPESRTVATVLNNLGAQYMDDEQPEKAKSLYERALAVCRKIGKEAGPVHGHTLYNLAELERDQGNLDAAEQHARASLEVRKDAFGEKSGWYAQSLEMLGTILLEKKAYAKAEEVLRQNLEIRRLKSGWNRPVMIRAMRLLADACKAQENYDEATGLYQRALQRGESGLGQKDDIRAEALESFADLLRKTGKPDEAAKKDAQAKAIREALEKK